MDGFKAFQDVKICVGKIIEASPFPEAKKPAYKLTIDLGPELGIRKSSAQITAHYAVDELLEKQVLCLVNVQPRQIGPFMSEVLTLGVPDIEGKTVLIGPDMDVPLGVHVY